MGAACPPYYGKSKFYAWKKQRAVNKIAKLEKVIKACDEKIAQQNKKS